MRMPRILLYIAASTFVLFACASPQPRSDSVAQNAQLKREFLNDFARVKLKKNGSALLCDQQAYVQCYEITQAQCMRELEDPKEVCFKRAERKYPDDLASVKEVDAFSKYYITCVSLHHFALHANKDSNRLSMCLKNIKWDKEQRDRSLMK